MAEDAKRVVDFEATVFEDFRDIRGNGRDFGGHDGSEADGGETFIRRIRENLWVFDLTLGSDSKADFHPSDIQQIDLVADKEIPARADGVGDLFFVAAQWSGFRLDLGAPTVRYVALDASDTCFRLIVTLRGSRLFGSRGGIGKGLGEGGSLQQCEVGFRCGDSFGACRGSRCGGWIGL